MCIVLYYLSNVLNQYFCLHFSIARSIHAYLYAFPPSKMPFEKRFLHILYFIVLFCFLSAFRLAVAAPLLYIFFRSSLLLSLLLALFCFPFRHRSIWLVLQARGFYVNAHGTECLRMSTKIANAFALNLK